MWEQSDSRIMAEEIKKVGSGPYGKIFLPTEIAEKNPFLGEAGMETFLKSLLKKLGNKWGPVSEPKKGTAEYQYVTHAEEAGLLVRVDSKLYFHDRARVFLAQRAGLRH